MSKTSSETAQQVAEFPVAIDRSSELDGYTVSFVAIKEGHSLAPMLASLPGGHCSCPHWGYVFEGRLVVHYAGGDEVLEAGDAFVMPPGHVPEADAGTRFVMFSPAAELAATEAAIRAGMEAAQRS